MERPDRLVPVSDWAGGRRLHPGLTRTRISRGSRRANLPAGAFDRPGLPPGRALAAAASPRTSRAILRDVSDAAPKFGHGHVRLCLSLVSHGRPAGRDLAGLSPRHRDHGPGTPGLEALDLSRYDARIEQCERACAAH